MNTLVYIRRHKGFNASVLAFAKDCLGATSVTTVSEYFNGTDRIDMNASAWDYDADIQAYVDENFYLPNLIFRDRVLRNTPFKECLLLIRRATGNILSILKGSSFDALVTYPIDNYIMDILIQVAKKKGIPCYGVSSFFYAGYKRITVYGEHNRYRVPDEAEVDAVLHGLQHNFRSHMAPSRNKALKAAFVRYVKNKGRYPIFYLFAAKLLGRREYDFLATPYNTTVRRLANFFVERHFVGLEKINFSKSTIFVPMHYFPEATIEYWCGDPTKVEFEDMLRCKIDELSKRYDQIILKEHPATMFDNPSSFYKELISNPKVVLVDPFISTSLLLEYVDVVGCWTGTSGIEALVNGKSVELFVKEQYYMQALQHHPHIVEHSGEAIKVNDAKLFIAEILRGSIVVE
ncbi:capsular polysaccharide export protein, LipB/KpsS family [Kordiimonas aquimaris]|uniref:capsular polysaccharide export protein, LipB/KpsS family n=1 Tax=Kordiimonas aquimaris TaxID=707591 RepID=UPI0021CE8C91|nr:hypothetical protein [Kordiimonas aquimaris]